MTSINSDPNKKPLAVGDRVRVYHRNVITGKVDTISPDGHIGVIEDGFYSQHDESPFHPKQCRRLKPRQPKQEDKRRDWWVLRNIVDDSPGAFFSSRREAAGSSLFLKAGWELFHLVEQRENEVLVDRAKLAKAWDKNGSNKCIYPLHDHSEFFDMLCTALGLPAKEQK